MRLPTRKKEQDRHALSARDPHLTQEAIDRMQRKVDQLKKERPLLAEEVARTAAMGDLSENAAYQEAKYRLRRVNSQILSLEDRIKHAVPIETGPADGLVRIGSTVVVSSERGEQTFQILGSQESNPMRGRISYVSPLGKLLMGKRAGDDVEMQTSSTVVTYHIKEVK